VDCNSKVTTETNGNGHKKANSNQEESVQVKKTEITPPTAHKFMAEHEFFMRSVFVMEFAHFFFPVFDYSFKNSLLLENFDLAYHDINSFITKVANYIDSNERGQETACLPLRQMLFKWKMYPKEDELELRNAIEENHKLLYSRQLRVEGPKNLMSPKLNARFALIISESICNIALQTQSLRDSLDNLIIESSEEAKKERREFSSWKKQMKEGFARQKSSDIMSFSDCILERQSDTCSMVGSENVSLDFKAYQRQEKVTRARINWKEREKQARYKPLGSDLYGNEYWRFFSDTSFRVWCKLNRNNEKCPFVLNNVESESNNSKSSSEGWIFFSGDSIDHLVKFLHQEGRAYSELVRFEKIDSVGSQESQSCDVIEKISANAYLLRALEDFTLCSQKSSETQEMVAADSQSICASLTDAIPSTNFFSKNRM
jgi:hypothetical protein